MYMKKKYNFDIEKKVIEWTVGNDSASYDITKVDEKNKIIYFDYIDYFGVKQKMMLNY